MGHNEISPEQKHIEMKRLEKEGRWPEADRYKNTARKELRAAGQSRSEAVAGSWKQMIEEFPPLSESKPEPDPDGEIIRLANVEDVDSRDDLDAMMDREVDGSFDKEAAWQWAGEHAHDLSTTARDAPSPWAWLYLKFVRANPTKFVEIDRREEDKKRQEKVKADDEEDLDLCDKTVRNLLKEIQDNAQRQWEKDLVKNTPEAVQKEVQKVVADWQQKCQLTLPEEAVRSIGLSLTHIVDNTILAVRENPEVFAAEV